MSEKSPSYNPDNTILTTLAYTVFKPIKNIKFNRLIAAICYK